MSSIGLINLHCSHWRWRFFVGLCCHGKGKLIGKLFILSLKSWGCLHSQIFFVLSYEMKCIHLEIDHRSVFVHFEWAWLSVVCACVRAIGLIIA